MTSSLRPIDRQLLFVRRLLSEDGDDPRSRAEAIRLLRDVEGSLSRCALDAPSRAFAARLLRVRSDLRGHLVAAATLEEFGRPPRGAAGMLKRAGGAQKVWPAAARRAAPLPAAP